MLNITDAYKSKIFDPQSDARTGYRTNSVRACVALSVVRGGGGVVHPLARAVG